MRDCLLMPAVAAALATALTGLWGCDDFDAYRWAIEQEIMGLQ